LKPRKRLAHANRARKGAGGDVTLGEFRALADFRHLLRSYLNGTEEASQNAGLESLHYSTLLQLVGLPEFQRPTVSYVARRLLLRHHSAVELVNRMERRNLVRRVRAKNDRRLVEVHVTPTAKGHLKRLVRHRIEELRVVGPALARSINACFRGSRR
jgi:DNA-binding MarR family transcriptional regulator